MYDYDAIKRVHPDYAEKGLPDPAAVIKDRQIGRARAKAEAARRQLDAMRAERAKLIDEMFPL